ncbi:hypothetical protein F3Y22_tig00111274pilonHSYRG00013 [Hibiscus syriacus]|uniref:Uncharacterized protein n=1 Tax=Hibiscus syriacus TaxID=106335 RepID=A0A6A2YRV0_HIBSY|nr:hypothetical protein F3Y22_tig00111274pilonHSYRG00013 [Hibiscus syriacus]
MDERGSSSSNERQEARRPYHCIIDGVVGLDDDIKNIVSLVVDETSFQGRVCGMGGLGKTTLAKKIYWHNRVIRHFDSLAWVYVSQQFQKRAVWEDILTSLTSINERGSKDSDEELARKLFSYLKNKKCLVFLDDIWVTEAWDLLKPGFPTARDSRSKFLLTSRNKQIVSHADRRGLLYELQCLNDEKNWELFREARGRHFGYTRNSVHEWEMVFENVKSYLHRGKGLHVEDVLALSYDDLPSYLRPCLLYLSIFPEDDEIEAERLIQLWVAEGFVSSEEIEGKMMEDVAEGWLVELVERCMVQVGERDPIGKIKTCRMHDLTRDLCLSWRGRIILPASLAIPPFLQLAELLHINPLPLGAFNKADSDCNSLLRVYLCHEDEGSWTSSLNNSKLLRVLEFQVSDSDRDPFKYDAIGWGADIYVPDVIWKLEQLRYLYLPDARQINKTKFRLDTLRNLQTLVSFMKWNCFARDISKLTTLRKLEKCGGFDIEDFEEYLDKNLPIITSKHLRFLSMTGERIHLKLVAHLISSCVNLCELVLIGWMDKLPEYHHFPSNITVIRLDSSRLKEDPMPM